MINHELWRVVAGGGFTLLLNKIQSFTDLDLRARLLDDRDVLGWLRVELSGGGSLGYAIQKATITALWNLIADRYYNPTMAAQDPPLPVNAASDGTTLSADDPGEGYTNAVYSFNGLTFARLGPLSENNEPAAGNYVIAVESDTSDAVGLPSSFLAVS